ncbi:hypothetical protein PHET_03310 [Paragonimus heterotremus]|uniref:Uncharacterized protein n=1 Tax=Paragonimus heterotremus TaxID=100268 RepID=A0A8J4TK20_9TREM|nr:hypothetical protein PHET_03310 [Paragonimus heterotremus]
MCGLRILLWSNGGCTYFRQSHLACVFNISIIIAGLLTVDCLKSLCDQSIFPPEMRIVRRGSTLKVFCPSGLRPLEADEKGVITPSREKFARYSCIEGQYKRLYVTGVDSTKFFCADEQVGRCPIPEPVHKNVTLNFQHVVARVDYQTNGSFFILYCTHGIWHNLNGAVLPNGICFRTLDYTDFNKTHDYSKDRRTHQKYSLCTSAYESTKNDSSSNSLPNSSRQVWKNQDETSNFVVSDIAELPADSRPLQISVYTQTTLSPNSVTQLYLNVYDENSKTIIQPSTKSKNFSGPLHERWLHGIYYFFLSLSLTFLLSSFTLFVRTYRLHQRARHHLQLQMVRNLKDASAVLLV